MSELYKKGDVIGGKFEVLGTLGKGGFGVVYLTRERGHRDPCALKSFRDEFLADGKVREAFKKEALLWVNLGEHPFILSARWVEVFSGRLFVQMDYVAPDSEGRTSLADHLAKGNRALDPDQTLEWGIQFCFGMEHASAHGVKCHRDINPRNILITQEGTLKIADFGLAAAAELAWRSMGSQGQSLVTGGAEQGFGLSLLKTDGRCWCGTPGYIPPEVYRHGSADICSDIYSFGLVLWQMSTGSNSPPFLVPYRGDIEGFLRGVYRQQLTCRLPPVPEPLCRIVERCVKPDPTERYQHFGELRGDLARIFRDRTGIPVQVPEVGQPSALFWGKKGGSLLGLGRYEDAIGCLDKVLAIDPRDATAWGNKGVALAALGRLEDAIGCYDRALEINPQSATIWSNKGNALDGPSRREEAIACYDKALAVDPSSASAWHNKGVTLANLERHKEAVDCYDKALAIEPRRTDSLSGKGEALDDLGRYEEAIACYDSVLAIDPHFLRAWQNKGDTLRAMNLHEEAAGCYDKATTIDPRSIKSWMIKAHVLSKLGRHEEAIACYDIVLDIQLGHPGAWCDRGIALRALGRHEEATICHHKVLSNNPQIADHWWEKGKSLNMFACFDPIGYENALGYFERVAFLEPGSVKGWDGMASALSALNRREEANVCYDRVLAIDPQVGDAWFSKGIALDELGRHESAVECFDKALAIKPLDGCIWNWKGSALTALGRHEEAVRCYDKALANHPIPTVPLYEKALAEDASGRTVAAVESYRRFLALKQAQQGSTSAEDQKKITHAKRRLEELAKSHD